MLSFKTKLSYGIGGACDNTIYTLLSTYELLYLTTVAGISPAVAGTIAALGSFWECIFGPIVGFTSDSLESKYGHRKPFILFAAFPIAVVTSLLFTTINATSGVKAVYYAVMTVLLWSFFSIEFVPYISWGAELTENYHERTVLRSYAYIFNQVGMCIGMVMPTIIVDYAMNLGKTSQQSWQIVGIFAGICAGVALLICALTIHQDDNPDFVKPEVKKSIFSLKMIPELIRDYMGILKLKPIRYLLGASMAYLTANTIFSSARVFFMKYNLNMGDKVVSLMMFIITISGVVFVPFLTKASGYFDKKTVFMSVIGGMGVIFILMGIFGIHSFAACIGICLIYSLANTAYWQLQPSMIYDICEVQELEQGEAHAGAVISLQALSESICMAIGIQILGIILDASGFVEGNAIQPESALRWVGYSATIIPGIFMILVFVMMLKYPVTKEYFAGVLKELEKRRAGKQSADKTTS